MNPYSDMYPDEWVPPRPKEEQAEEEWAEAMEKRKHDA